MHSVQINNWIMLM